MHDRREPRRNRFNFREENAERLRRQRIGGSGTPTWGEGAFPQQQQSAQNYHDGRSQTGGHLGGTGNDRSYPGYSTHGIPEQHAQHYIPRQDGQNHQTSSAAGGGLGNVGGGDGRRDYSTRNVYEQDSHPNRSPQPDGSRPTRDMTLKEQRQHNRAIKNAPKQTIQVGPTTVEVAVVPRGFVDPNPHPNPRKRWLTTKLNGLGNLGGGNRKVVAREVTPTPAPQRSVEQRGAGAQSPLGPNQHAVDVDQETVEHMTNGARPVAFQYQDGTIVHHSQMLPAVEQTRYSNAPARRLDGHSQAGGDRGTNYRQPVVAAGTSRAGTQSHRVAPRQEAAPVQRARSRRSARNFLRERREFLAWTAAFTGVLGVGGAGLAWATGHWPDFGRKDGGGNAYDTPPTPNAEQRRRILATSVLIDNTHPPILVESGIANVLSQSNSPLIDDTQKPKEFAWHEMATKIDGDQKNANFQAAVFLAMYLARMQRSSNEVIQMRNPTLMTNDVSTATDKSGKQLFPGVQGTDKTKATFTSFGQGVDAFFYDTTNLDPTKFGTVQQFLTASFPDDKNGSLTNLVVAELARFIK